MYFIIFKKKLICNNNFNFLYLNNKMIEETKVKEEENTRG